VTAGKDGWPVHVGDRVGIRELLRSHHDRVLRLDPRPILLYDDVLGDVLRLFEQLAVYRGMSRPGVPRGVKSRWLQGHLDQDRIPLTEVRYAA